MTAKQELEQIRMIEIDIAQRREVLEELKSTITSLQGIRYDKDIVDTSATSDAIPNAIIRIVETKERIANKISELAQVKECILSRISAINDSRYRQILFLRYVKYMTYDEISDFMNYSYRQCQRLHGEALNEYSKMKDVIQCHIDS